MWVVYDIVAFFILLFYLPIYLFKRKFHKGFLERFGMLSKEREFNVPIWIHAVSVGEAMALKVFVAELKKKFPQRQLVISTVTPTGNKIARRLAGSNDRVIYLPIDISFIVRRVIDKIKPVVFIIAETELWPNIISYFKRKGTPVLVVNGRFSDASFRGYMAIRLLIKPIFDAISFFCVQTERDAKRLKHLGVAVEKIQVTGNMKFDILALPGSKDIYAQCRSQMGVGPQDKLLVAGSTHPGEEEIVFRAFKELLSEFPKIRLFIAPRHPERAKEVQRLASCYGFSSIFISNMQSTLSISPQPTTVFILDTIGELAKFYGAADVVFVGGSLVKIGGHNILEPAALSKPILFGRYTFKFRDITGLFLKNSAGTLVKDARDLTEKITCLLRSPEQAAQQGRRALSLLEQNRGASQKTLTSLSSYLK